MANDLLKKLRKQEKDLCYGQILPYKIRRFVTLFDGGNYEKISRRIGVSVSTLKKWGRDPRVIEALRVRDEIHDSPLIADRIQRQEFWSETMLNEEEDMKYRLKASELLGRSECDFTDTVMHKGQGGGIQIVVNTGVPRAPDSPGGEVQEPEKKEEIEDAEVVPEGLLGIW